jgi:hypothetical protein
MKFWGEIINPTSNVPLGKGVQDIFDLDLFELSTLNDYFMVGFHYENLSSIRTFLSCNIVNKVKNLNFLAK